MSADVVDEVDSHTARTVVVGIAVEAQWTQVSFELAFQYRCGLPAAPVACAVGAHQDYCFVMERFADDSIG